MSKKLVFSLFFVLCSLVLANAVSALLTVNSISGSYGTENWRTSNDSVVINITSSSANVSVSGIDASACGCEQSGSRYSCICAWTDEKNNLFASYTIKNDLGDSVTKQIHIDNSIGTINYNIQQINGEVVLNYNIIDTGYNNAAECSGLSKIEVYSDSDVLNEIDFNETPSDCKYLGNLTLSITDSGEKIFYLKVYDNVGNIKNSALKNVTIDISPPEVSNLRIMSNGKELTTIAQGAEQIVDIYFDVTEDDLSNITADISAITTNTALKPTYAKIDVPLSDCRLNVSDDGSKIYTCFIKSKKLKLSKDTINISFNIYDDKGNYAIISLDKTFTFDNSKPDVNSIVSDYCDSSGKCFVKNGLNKIWVKLGKDNFDNKRVYIDVDGKKSRVYNCTGGECYALALVSCSSGDTLTASITAMNGDFSQDDSGNRIPSFSANLYCDNSAPTIGAVSVTGNYQIGELKTLVISGSQLTITANVRDNEATELKAVAELDGLKNTTPQTVSCVYSSQHNFTCIWTVANINNGYYNANINLKINDTAGNFAEKTLTVQVLGFKSDNLTPSSLNLARGGAGLSVPSSINRVALQLALDNGIYYPIFANYDISKTQQNAKVLYQVTDVSSCSYKGKDGKLVPASYVFDAISVASPYEDFSAASNSFSNRLDFVFSSSFSGDQIGINMLDDTFVVSCNISAYVQEGNDVYKKPQMLVLETTFRMKNSVLGEPGQEFVDKIKEAEKSVNGTGWMWVGKLNSWISTLQTICDAKQYLDYVDDAGVTINTVGLATQIVDGGTTKKIGKGLSNFVEALDSKIWNSKGKSGTGILSEVCMFATCSLPFNQDLKKTWDFEGNSFLKTLEQKQKDSGSKFSFVPSEISVGLSESNLKNSIVMSTLTGCLPGILYNLNTYRQVKCEYILCLKEQSAYGLDVSVCEIEKSSKWCSIVVGELFELPFLRIAKNLGEGFSSLSQFGISKGLTKLSDVGLDKLGCNDPGNDAGLFLCRLPHAIQQSLSTAEVANKGANFHFDTTTDVCDKALCSGEKCFKGIDLGIKLPNSPFKPKAIPTYILPTEYLKGAAVGNEESRVKWNIYVAQHGDLGLKIITPGATPDAVKQVYLDYKEKTKGKQVGAGEIQKEDGIKDEEQPIEYWKQEQNRVNQQLEEYNRLLEPVDQTTVPPGDADAFFNKINENTRTAELFTNQRTAKAAQLSAASGQKVYASIDDAQKDTKNCLGDISKSCSVYYYDESGNLIQYTVNPNGKEEYESADCTIHPGLAICAKYNTLEKDKKDTDRKLHEAQVRQTADLLVRTALDTFNLKQYLTSDKLLKWIPGASNLVTKITKATNPEEWKKSVCAPGNLAGSIFGATAPAEDYAYQCSGERTGCNLVLTYGAEVLHYNSTYNVYTFVMMMGPIMPKDSSDTAPIKFNVRFSNSKGETILGYNSWASLAKSQTGSITRAFSRDKLYDKVCIIFEKKFPPANIGTSGEYKTEYCRDIKNDIFNTGGVPTESDIATDPIYGGGGGTTVGSGFLE